MQLLVLNAGSSSLKFALYSRDGANLAVVDRGSTEVSAARHSEAVEQVLQRVRSQTKTAGLAAVVHRVVHGGSHFTEAVRIDAGVLARLESLVPLAPLHQPHSLAAIRELCRQQPQLTQVACFDTAFHCRQPAVARLFALPHRLTEEGVRPYGFHGLSYEHAVSALPALAGGTCDKLIVAHLGSGASLCAIRAGCSVATTMSFTPLDGIAMATRPGALDPGVLLYLMQQQHMDAARLEHLLYQESGLLGVSGISGDVRELLASAAPRAQLALELFVYHIVRAIGSLAAVLQGVEALVFTGGIGENAPTIRAAVCRASAWLGLQLDEEANRRAAPRISTRGSRVSAWIVPSDENLVMARQALRLLGSAAPE